MNALQNWIKNHNACKEGADWAIATGCQTVQEIWRRDDVKPEWRIWIAMRKNMIDDKTLRLFACRCVREVWHLLTDDRSKHAVEVAERHANNNATNAELHAAGDAAWAAAGAAAGDAARAAAGDAARKKQAEILFEMVPTLQKV